MGDRVNEYAYDPAAVGLGPDLSAITRRWTGTDPRRPDPPSDWMTDAACRGADPRLFFPTQRGDQMLAGRAICARCPVQVQCLEWALATGEHHGLWGGTTEKDRRLIRARRPS